MRRQLKRLFTLLNRRDKQWLIVILIFMLLASALEVVSIGSVPLVIAFVADPSRLAELPFLGDEIIALEGQSKRKLVVLAGIAFLVIFVIRTLVLMLVKYMQFRFAATRQVRISSQLFKSYLLAPYLYHTENNSAELIRNIYNSAMGIGGHVIAMLMGGIQQLIVLISILMLLMLVEPIVTLVSLSVFGLFGGIFIRATSGRTRALGRLEMQERKFALQGLRQSFDGIREITLLGKPAYFLNEFRTHMQGVALAQRNKQFLSFLSGPLLEFLAIFTLIALASSLLALGSDMGETVALLGLYAVAFARLRASLAVILGSYTNLAYNLVAINPVYEGIVELASNSIVSETVNPMQLHQELELRNVNFQYPGTEQRVLRDISVTIPRGAYVGLVGSTGAGKSTLVNLLLGFLPPDEGEILADGQDIHGNLKGWQKNIGYVPQDLFLLDDTIRRNVALGCSDGVIDDEKVFDVLNKAQLAEFVRSLPSGLDSMVGERGVRLSGGQKQRISIARALYRAPQVLVLDEATASLDHKTESVFLDAISEIKNQATIISIAHRESTLRDCDAIYEIHNGILRSFCH